MRLKRDAKVRDRCGPRPPEALLRCERLREERVIQLRRPRQEDNEEMHID